MSPPLLLMSRPMLLRPLIALSVALVAGVPVRAVLGAQATETVVRRAPRAAADDSSDRQLRRLERRADSLAQLYTESGDLSAGERRGIGDALDRTVQQIEMIADNLVRKLVETGTAELESPEEVLKTVVRTVTDDLQVEDKLNEEVREILAKVEYEMRDKGIQYHEMFKIVKQKLARERKLIL